MLQIICSEHQTNVICVAKTERVLWLRWKIAEGQKLQDFCVVTVTIRVLWAPTREQNCKSVRGEKNAFLQWIWLWQLFKCFMWLNLCCEVAQRCGFPQFLPDDWEPIWVGRRRGNKSGSQAFSVLQLVNFVQGENKLNLSLFALWFILQRWSIL